MRDFYFAKINMICGNDSIVYILTYILYITTFFEIVLLYVCVGRMYCLLLTLSSNISLNFCYLLQFQGLHNFQTVMDSVVEQED